MDFKLLVHIELFLQCEHVLSKDETILPIFTTNSMVSIVLNLEVKFKYWDSQSQILRYYDATILRSC